MIRPGAFLLACIAATSLACGSSPGPGSGSSPGPGSGDACTLPDAGTNGATCQYPTGQSDAAAPLIVKNLGHMKVGDTASFDVPAGIVSVTIIEQALSAPGTITYQPPHESAFTLDNTAVPRLVTSSSTTLYDDTKSQPSDGSGSLVFFASSSPGTGTLTIPNTALSLSTYASGVPAGIWTIEASDYGYECALMRAAGACCAGGSSSSTYDVTVIMKPLTNGTFPTKGALDVAIYFATDVADRGGTHVPLTAATAPTDPDLNQMERTLKLLLGRANITVSSVKYFDLPAEVQTRYAQGVSVDQTGNCSDLADLFRSNAQFAGAGNTLNIFLVSLFKPSSSDTGQSGSIVGIDGTIPGPSTIVGTGNSGAAVSVEDLRANASLCDTSGTTFTFRCGADQTAYTIAHETGHYLGLYHTTESDGTFFDPLDDTPKCPCSSCNLTKEVCAGSSSANSSSTPHQMGVNECTKSPTCGGGDNLMFWLLDIGSKGSLSDEQQRVMRANPLVQ